MLRLERIALAGLALALLVVVVSAAIRLGAEGPAVSALRVAHRAAASATVLVVLALAWRAWRERRAGGPVALAAALVVLLTSIGIAAGQAPPFAASMGNILGGLCLAATLAWLAGARADHRPLFAAVLLAQCTLGAWLSLAWRERPLTLLLAHALLGLALAGAAIALAVRLKDARVRAALLVLALAVPVAGATAALLDRALAPALAHAVAAALLVSSLVLAQSSAA